MADKENKKVIIKKVKKGGHAAHHGGSWKVAYADFVTAMMAFFLVMWLVNSVTQEKREQISQYFQSFSLMDTGGKADLIPATDLSQIQQQNNPPPVVEPISESPSGPAKEKSEAEKAAEAIKEAIEAKTPDLKNQFVVKAEDNKVIVEVTEDAHGKPLFALGRSDLTVDAKRALAAVSPQLSKAGKGKLAVEGHTDAYAYAGERFTNWELSTDRASASRRELEKAGVSADSVGVVSGYAATRLYLPDNPYDPKNRRIRLVMELPQPKGAEASGETKAKGSSNIFAKPQAPAAPAPPPPSPIPQEKREILDQQIERLYDEQIKSKANNNATE